MKSYTCFLKRICLCLLLACTMLFTASAATWNEMQKNGAVSDGGIRLGDARDGIVSDVSETGKNGVIGDIITDASDALHDGLNGTSGTGNGNSVHGSTADHTAQSTPAADVTSSHVTTAHPSTTHPTTTHTTNNAASGERDGGMTAGIIIAVLVVAAVIIVIFLLIPKRKR